ncbi:dihydrolipoyl dehydrogenase family protein [Paenibacillus wulumuqiensis]|uniref:dihydrolipoyl dehydrogenase family protein n=1 Tax=Paenibacillus wulumuqiensis TaxID=1567107 RepID=UPI0006192DD0|nr:NAD(P)/FAD-dependent oxidoreductase [Paenibacillus wulumuqiensis]
MTKQFDVLFIGSGQGAWNAALPLSAAGKKVGMIERDKILGVCTNYGCNPKIILDGPIKVMEDAELFGPVGLTSQFKLNWQQLMDHKNKIIGPLPVMMEKNLQKAGVEIIRGEAQFVDASTVAVNNEHYTADQIVIAAGHRPASLNIPGEQYMKTSNEFLYLPELPERIVFIGAGYVSMELASISVKTGAEVHVVQSSDHILNGFHQPYANKMIDKMKQEGIHFHFNDHVTGVEQQGSELAVTTEKGLHLTAGLVINATGRVPNADQLNLEAAGVEYNKHGIVVNDRLQTSQPHIYATGDILDKTQPRLTPTAVFEAKYLAGSLLGTINAPIQYPPIATIAFTVPRIAQIGISIEEAEQSSDYKVKPVELGKQWDFAGRNDTEAHLTLVYDQENKLVGAAAYSQEALEIINSLTPVITLGLTAEDADKLIYAFPSFETMIPSYLHQANQAQ